MLLEFALIAMFDGHQREVKVFETASECAEAYDYLNGWVVDARREARLAGELTQYSQLLYKSYYLLKNKNPGDRFISNFTFDDLTIAIHDPKKYEAVISFADANKMVLDHDEKGKFFDFLGDAASILWSLAHYRSVNTELENLKSTYSDFGLPFPLNIDEPRLPDHEMLPESVKYTCLPLPK